MYLWTECSRLEKSWLGFLAVSYLLLFGVMSFNGLALAIAISGSLCIFFAAKAKIATFYFGIAYNLLYAFHCHMVNDDLIAYLHLFFHFPLQMIGIYIWQKNRIGHPTLQEDTLLKHLFPQGWIAILLALILIAVFVAHVIYSLSDSIPNLIIVAFTFSIIANVLMVGRFIECWVGWMAVNVFNIGYWAYSAQNSIPTYISGFMMTLFLIMCIYGCVRWNRISKRQNDMYLGPYCSLTLASQVKKYPMGFIKNLITR